jgi:hypothetical protein
VSVVLRMYVHIHARLACVKSVKCFIKILEITNVRLRNVCSSYVRVKRLSIRIWLVKGSNVMVVDYNSQ